MLSRREFLKLCFSTSLTLSLSNTLLPLVAQAVEDETVQRPPVIWLELGSCTGDSISLDNAFDPNLKKLLMEIIDLRYHWLYLPVHGDEALEVLYKTVEEEEGQYILIIEGSVITRDNGRYNYVAYKDDKFITGLEMLKFLSAKAKWVVAVGSCACWGGPVATYPNLAKAKGVWEVVDRDVINVPGCPAQADWMTGTLSHLILYGKPELDSYMRPTMFFGKTIHQLCSRRSLYEEGMFAQHPGEDGCLYKVGCKGPVTYADCPLRQWNNHVNWPIEASTPCIGCVNPGFPDSSMPFLQHLPNLNLPGAVIDPTKAGLFLGGATALGLSTHLAGNILSGRFHKKMLDGTNFKEDPSGEQVPQETIVMQKLDQLLNQQKTILEKNQKPIVLSRLKQRSFKVKNLVKIYDSCKKNYRFVGPRKD